MRMLTGWLGDSPTSGKESSPSAWTAMILPTVEDKVHVLRYRPQSVPPAWVSLGPRSRDRAIASAVSYNVASYAFICALRSQNLSVHGPTGPTASYGPVKIDQNPQSCHIIMYDLYQGTNKLKYYYCWWEQQELSPLGWQKYRCSKFV